MNHLNRFDLSECVEANGLSVLEVGRFLGCGLLEAVGDGVGSGLRDSLSPDS